MKNKQKYHVPRRETFLIYMMLFVFISILGAIMNQVVVKENEGRMPVIGYGINSDTHISYNYLEKVNYEILGDRYSTKWLNDAIMYYSIGDVLILIGAIMILIMGSCYIKELYLDKKTIIKTKQILNQNEK